MKERRRRNGFAAFRAVELEVRAALVAGRTILSIYEEKRGRLAMSYAQFARYVGRLRGALEVHSPASLAISGAASLRSAPVPRRRAPVPAGPGPPKGRPEDAVPTVDMDRFAAQALKNKDLF